MHFSLIDKATILVKGQKIGMSKKNKKGGVASILHHYFLYLESYLLRTEKYLHIFSCVSDGILRSNMGHFMYLETER